MWLRVRMCLICYVENLYWDLWISLWCGEGVVCMLNKCVEDVVSVCEEGE